MPRTYPLDDNDIVVWKLNEASGSTFVNSSTSPNKPANSSLTLTGTLSSRGGDNTILNYVKFPASSSTYMSSANGLLDTYSWTNGITMSCWVYLAGWGQTYGCLFYKNYRASGWTDPWGTPGFQYDNTGYGIWFSAICVDNGGNPLRISQNCSGLLRLSCWHHLALTYDYSTFKTYHNGALVSTMNETRAMKWGGGPWRIGGEPACSNQGIDAYVSEYRICDVARSGSYIRDMYHYVKAREGTLPNGEIGGATYYDGGKYPNDVRGNVALPAGATPDYYESVRYPNDVLGDVESSGLPGPNAGGITTYYTHRAKRISTGLFVFWNHTAPDPAGDQSGINPSDLTDIVIVRVYNSA